MANSKRKTRKPEQIALAMQFARAEFEDVVRDIKEAIRTGKVDGYLTHALHCLEAGLTMYDGFVEELEVA